jgi:hypothetical protein
MTKCNTCNQIYSPDCDYDQGRCPHHPPYINPHSMRFLNLFKTIKGWFNRGNTTQGPK